MDELAPAPTASDRVPNFLARAYARGDIVLAAGVAALCAARLLDPATIEDGPVLCPFRQLTGLPCPGCGLTRSWVYLTHGDWASAVHANAFGPVLAALVLAAVAARITMPRMRREPPRLGRLAVHPVMVLALWLPWLVFAASRATLVALG